MPEFAMVILGLEGNFSSPYYPVAPTIQFWELFQIVIHLPVVFRGHPTKVQHGNSIALSKNMADY